MEKGNQKISRKLKVGKIFKILNWKISGKLEIWKLRKKEMGNIRKIKSMETWKKGIGKYQENWKYDNLEKGNGKILRKLKLRKILNIRNWKIPGKL